MSGESTRSEVVFAAGGTGGHIVPALAIALALKRKHPELNIRFIGVGKPLEEKLIRGAGFDLQTIEFLPLLGSSALGKLKLLFRLPIALVQCCSGFAATRPKLVFGFGGYPSIIPMSAAMLLGVPRYLHEQNQKVGLANRLLSKIATKVFAVTGAKGFAKPEQVTFLPLPVREQFYEVPDWQPSERINIAVIGGSQGAVTVNKAVLALVPLLKEKGISILHQTGTVDFKRVRDAYKEASLQNADVREFIEDPAQVYSWAHIVISRAGAMSVAELCAAGRPVIYVPLAIAGAHQYENIRAVVDAGGAVSLEQGEELAEKLRSQIESWINDPALMKDVAAKARAIGRSGGVTSTEVLLGEIENVLR